MACKAGKGGIEKINHLNGRQTMPSTPDLSETVVDGIKKGKFCFPFLAVKKRSKVCPLKSGGGDGKRRGGKSQTKRTTWKWVWSLCLWDRQGVNERVWLSVERTSLHITFCLHQQLRWEIKEVADTHTTHTFVGKRNRQREHLCCGETKLLTWYVLSWRMLYDCENIHTNNE